MRLPVSSADGFFLLFFGELVPLGTHSVESGRLRGHLHVGDARPLGAFNVGGAGTRSLAGDRELLALAFRFQELIFAFEEAQLLAELTDYE